MGHTRAPDLAVIAIYFVAMAGMGWYFRRRTGTTEQYFVGGRAYPGWLLGVSLFGAAISSITFIGYPADAFKTAYLRYVICLTLPVGVFVVGRWILPIFRRGRITSVFEYLEGRFGPRTRLYGASVFLIAQAMRISVIQYLVALLVHRLTGWDVTLCILLGGGITAYYTIVGGIEAVIWTDFVQSVILTAGGLLILGVIIAKLPGGLGQLFSVASADGKLMLGDLDVTDGKLHAAPWGLALSHKTVLMLVLVGIFQWLGEYTTNQEVVQKYCAAKSTGDAQRALWISCWTCVPTWGYFMLLGTGLYVFYKVFPDAQVAEMLSGARKAEEVLPHFVSTQLPAGLSGIVVAAVLAAAMSSMSSAMNSMSAVFLTDIYRRRLAAGRDDSHYVWVAKLTTLVSSVIMISGALVLVRSETKTLQHFYTEFTSIIAGGLLGLYLLGFLTTRGDGRAVGLGIAFAVSFATLISFAGLGWLPEGFTHALESRFDSYYTGLASNVVMFVVGFALAALLPAHPRDLRNLTLWTVDKSKILSIVLALLAVAWNAEAGVNEPAPMNRLESPSKDDQTVAVEDAQCRIEFDRGNGGLRRITNRRLGDECLKGGVSGTMPFRIYADLTQEFEIGINEKFQLQFKDPAAITRTVFRPSTCSVKTEPRGESLTLVYQGPGLTIQLQVRLAKQPGTSDWSLRVTNTGDVPREFLTCFPYFDGVRLGTDSRKNMATAMDQAGLLVPAWDRDGGVVGESNQMSMQWHAIWDAISRSALGLIFMDADVRPKRLLLKEPAIALHYFPPVTLAPGTSIDFPAVRVIVYQGDWRPAARAYRAWYDAAYPHVEPPAWFKESNGLNGIHFRKGDRSNYAGQVALQSFRDLPAAHLRAPVDNWEYAFFCQTSMRLQDREHQPHTDGDNIIREDMGGAEALREGIAGDHRLGLHATLYVEGYIVHEESEIVKTGNGQRWAIMRKDGTVTGPYTKQGFYHMCPGCMEWQEDLARMVARLLRETDADAIRLDSLGFYYWPCYNPAHRHDTPFGYNEWLKTLLAKVRSAAIAVKPDVLLLTEGSADWLGQWFHGALTSRCPRDLSPMRLAVGPFRNYVYASGALWGSLSGFPGGGCGGSDIDAMDWNWLCARFPVHEALVWGDVADDDPQSSDPQIVTRRFEGDGYWAIVAARPACQDAIWPRGTEISKEHADYTVTVPGLAAQVEDAVLCDVETLTWIPLATERIGADLRLKLRTNWGLVILRRPGGPAVVAFDPLPTLKKGVPTRLHLAILSRQPDASVTQRATITAPGLVVKPSEITLPGEVSITVPPNALPGNYAVSISTRSVLGARRFVVVQ